MIAIFKFDKIIENETTKQPITIVNQPEWSTIPNQIQSRKSGEEISKGQGTGVSVAVEFA